MDDYLDLFSKDFVEMTPFSSSSEESSEAFSPSEEAFSPSEEAFYRSEESSEAFSPSEEAFSPSEESSEAFSPSEESSEAFSPSEEAFCPSEESSEAFHPSEEAFCPSEESSEAFSPSEEAFSPSEEAFYRSEESSEAFSPSEEAFSPSEESSEAFHPSEEAFNPPSVFNQNLDVEDIQAVQTDDWREEETVEVLETPAAQPSVEPSPSKENSKKEKLPNFRIVYGAPEKTKKARTDGKYKREPVPIILVIALALLNAKEKAMGTQEIYNFMITHFKKYTEENRSNWKGTVRNKLSKNPEMFTKVIGKQTLYLLNLTEYPKWLMKEVAALESKRFFSKYSIDSFFGLHDSSVWAAMKRGTLGLPRMRMTDQRMNSCTKKRIEATYGPVHDPNGGQTGVPQVAYPPPSANPVAYNMPQQPFLQVYNPYLPVDNIYQQDFSQFNYFSEPQVPFLPQDDFSQLPLEAYDAADFFMPKHL